MFNMIFYKYCLEGETVDQNYLIFIPGYERTIEGNVIPKNTTDFKNPFKGRMMFSNVVDLYFINQCISEYSLELTNFLNSQINVFDGEKSDFLDHTEYIIRNYIAFSLTHCPTSINKVAETSWKINSEKKKTQLNVVLNWIDKKREFISEQNFNSSPTENKNYSFDGKTDLCELVFVLSKSEKIKKDGVPISMVKLAELFGEIFNVDLTGNTVNDLLNKRLRDTYRGENVKDTFIGQLNKIMLEQAMKVDKRKGQVD